MNKVWIACVVSTILLGSTSGFAAENMTPEDGAALRQRADELKRVREQNPTAQDGMKLDRPQGDVKIPKPRGEVKAKPAKTKKSKSERAKARLKRTANELPGALVR